MLRDAKTRLNEVHRALPPGSPYDLAARVRSLCAQVKTLQAQRDGDAVA